MGAYPALAVGTYGRGYGRASVCWIGGTMSRIENESLIRFVKTLPCIACGITGEMVHAHHVKSKGSGGDDVAENLIPLCFEHHRMVHDVGLLMMSSRFPSVNSWLNSAGWSYSALTGWGRE